MVDWQDLALQTAERFGGTMPHPETAAAIAAVYAKAPHAVQRAIDRVAADYDEGNIRSPWGVLKARVQQITVDTQQAQRGNDREKAVARAEQRIRNELLHYDRLDEVMDELFGPRGTLKDHDSENLRDRMEALWTELRPAGVQVEQDAVDRGLRYQAQPKIKTTEPASPIEREKTIQREIVEGKQRLAAMIKAQAEAAK